MSGKKVIPLVITISAAADRLGVSEDEIMELVREERLDAVNVGGRLQVKDDEISEWLRIMNNKKEEEEKAKITLPLICMRYPTIVPWLKKRGIVGIYKERVGKADVIGRVVIGELPIWLAIYVTQFVRIEMPYFQSGGDFTSPDDFDRAGAKLVYYNPITVEKIE